MTYSLASSKTQATLILAPLKFKVEFEQNLSVPYYTVGAKEFV